MDVSGWFIHHVLLLQLPSFAFSVPLALFHLSTEGEQHQGGRDKRELSKSLALVSLLFNGFQQEIELKYMFISTVGSCQKCLIGA